jgi:hypothetical protein
MTPRVDRNHRPECRCGRLHQPIGATEDARRTQAEKRELYYITHIVF